MKCQDVMKTDIECLESRATVAEAAHRMRDKGIGFLPICDEAGRPIGTLTDRDIVLRIVADARPYETTVTDVMTLEVVSCGPNDDVEVATERMSENRKSRIIVVGDDNSVVGVISLSDLARDDAPKALETLREITEREARA